MFLKKINLWNTSSFCISVIVLIPILTVFASFFEDTSNYYQILKDTFLFEYIFNSLTLLICVLVLTFIFPTKSLLIWSPILLIIIAIGYLYMKTKGKNQLLYTSLASFFCVVFVFNFYFILH